MRRLVTLALAALALASFAGRAPAQDEDKPPPFRDPVPELARQLKDPSVEVRRAAAFALKFLPSANDVVPNMVDALGDKDEIVRNNAIDAIVLTPPRRCVLPLAAALKSKDALVRQLAAATLGRVRRYTEEAIPDLTLLLKDPVVDVREAAAEALKKIHGSRREY